MATDDTPHIQALKALRGQLVEERRQSLDIFQSNKLVRAKNAAQALAEFGTLIAAVDAAIADERGLADGD